MDDQAAKMLWHLVTFVLGTGGGAGAILTWQLTKKKNYNGNSLGAQKRDIYQLLSEHNAEDIKQFAAITKEGVDRHIEVLERIGKVDTNVAILLERTKDK